MAPEVFCTNCGTALPAGARFCPRCGFDTASAAAPAPPSPPPPPSRASAWWIAGVPLAIIALLLIGWAVISGMPFGSREEHVQTITQGTSDTIGENAQTTDTVSQIGGAATTSSTPPPVAVAPPPVVTTPPPPVVVETQPAPAPRIVVTNTNPPMAASTTPAPAEISADDAVTQLRSYLVSNNPYSVSLDCLAVRNEGYRNHGYTLEVRDTCGDESLGEWRVDAVTREVKQK